MVLFTLCTLCIGSAFAQGDAGQPGEFTRYGVGARALGMGHAFTGLADDAGVMYWNPAGLMNVPRKQFTSMYTNLFLDSRYTYLGLALPRTLVGPDMGIGFGWVNLTMADFDQRDADNVPMGSFDLYEQAFMASGAREWVGPWGVLNYGLTMKLINQAFPGYISEQGWGFGIDAGLTFRPINMPVLKLIPLRYLMPLQVGAVLQNAVAPRVGVGSDKDTYPIAFRWGASYRIPLQDWTVHVLYDQEYLENRSTGHFAGFEAVTPQPFPGTSPRLRAGWNSRSKAPTFGGGLKLDYLNNAAIHLDFAYALKPDDALGNDFRLFLSIDFGQSYGVDYFNSRVADEPTDRLRAADYLQVISRFPNDQVVASAEALGGQYDTTNVVRYYRLIGGLKLADRYFLSAKRELRQNKIQSAQNQAEKAVKEFASAFRRNRAGLSETDLMNYSECLIMLERYRFASDTVLIEVETPSLRSFYLKGVCYKNQEAGGDEALEALRNAIDFEGRDQKSMRALAYLHLGQVQMADGNYTAALETFQFVVDTYYSPLDADYPRYPVYLDEKDRNLHVIADDALYHMAECYQRLGDSRNAAKAYAKINRFFPFSSIVEQANERLKRILSEP